MTSTAPAEPRPPSAINVASDLPRARQIRPGVQSHQALAHAQSQQVVGEEDDEVEIIDSRPVKRRKLSDAVSTPSQMDVGPNTAGNIAGKKDTARFTAAPWLTIVGRQPVEHSGSQGIASSQPPPLPDRPWASYRSKRFSLEEGRPACRVRKDVAVPKEPDSMPSPDDAPQFEGKRRADYFPWTGKHPEDVLSDVSVKVGYFDKAPNPAEKELNTAKAPLYNAFKHRSGLDSLSALFSLVLDRKNNHDAFCSTSSFKGPPPRVTLTEAKRKSWIADLANPEVALKRLSKTIPQGIRGQILLEQCLTHFVPLSRAIWFAKCVGANEIRTLKRKGVTPTVAQTAEAKWLREWTINIEQFIDQILTQCGQPNWKEKIHYAVQFATRLYANNLLDRDHYLEWIVKSFSAANMNFWPFWLMVIGLHRLDLVAFRKRGRQLAETLVSRYNTACAQPRQLLQPITKKLAQTLRACVVSRPACFLMPDKWSECEVALKDCLQANNPNEYGLLQRIRRANERVSVRENGIAPDSLQDHERVFVILDSIQSPFDIFRLLKRLENVCSDRDQAVEACLEWCTSKFRTGLTRIYLVARLFRRWAREGLNIDALISNFLYQKASLFSVDTSSLKHLFSELSRSRTISVSKHLQWLTVRGLPRADSFAGPEHHLFDDFDGTPISIRVSSDHSQLLTDLCSVGLDTHVWNLRNAMLGHSGFDVEHENSVLQACKDFLSRQLAASIIDEGRELIPDFSKLSWSMRTQLSHWLRNQTTFLFHAKSMDHGEKNTAGNPTPSHVRAFSLIRDVLEQLQDIAMLADVLRIAAYTKDDNLLATIVDVVNLHSDTLSVIGAFEPLQQLCCQAYLTLRPVKLSMPILATALVELCQQHPSKLTPIKALQQDFVRGDRGRAVAACSPFSDGVAESLQQAGASFYDDFEAILQTESNMNEQTMTGLFTVLIDRIVRTHVSSKGHDNPGFALCQLLCRLKTCRNHHGEALIKRWLTKLFNGHVENTNVNLLINLVSTRCVSLESMLDICQASALETRWKKSLHDLIRLATKDDANHDFEQGIWYSIKLATQNLTKDRPYDTLNILAGNNGSTSSGNNIGMSVIAAVISNPEAMKSLSKPAWMVVSQKLSEALGQIRGSDSVVQQAQTLFESASPLSLSFSHLRLRMLCQNATTKGDDTVQEEIAQAFCDSISNSNSSLSRSPATLQALLRATGPSIGAKVRAKMELAFFLALPKFLQSKMVSQPPLPTTTEMASTTAALRRVSHVSTDSTVAGQSVSCALLIEKLSIYMKLLGSSCTTNTGNGPSSPATAVPQTVLTSTPAVPFNEGLRTFILATLDVLETLLQMVSIKRAAFGSVMSQPSPTAAKQNQQDQIKLLGILITIATHPTWSMITTNTTPPSQQHRIKDIIETALDVGATLVDDMADEPRQFCLRILKEKARDERVQWILGSVNTCGSVQWVDAGHGLHVYHEGRGVTGEFRPKVWEMLEGGGSGGSNDACLGLGLFGAKKVG